MAARSAWSEKCKGRKACREDDAGRVVGQGLQGHTGECKCMQGRAAGGNTNYTTPGPGGGNTNSRGGNTNFG